MNQADRAISAGHGAQHRQRQRVVAPQRQWNAAVGQNTVIGQLNATNAVFQAVRIDGDIPQVGHLQPFKRCGSGAHVVRADHHRFLADLPRPVARATAV
ncbi:hypothetical protein D3C81_1616850 [compost metagenome]